MSQQKFSDPLTHEASILLLGSCFSDEIGHQFVQNGFQATINPGGTIFHPLALAHLLEWALNENKQLRRIQREDIWLSWDLSGSVYALTEQELQLKLKQLRKKLFQGISESTHLMVTFGTSWAYKLLEDQQIVANCHKFPADKFSKENTSVEEMCQVWKALIGQIKSLNPEIKLIFTVSPVRHSKDGLHENNLSKARLFLLVEQLTAISNCYYFPAYELVNDQLRDYSFFKEDGIHPNAKATAYVWDFFKRNHLEPATQLVLKDWDALQLAMKHRIMYPESKSAAIYRKHLHNQKEEFFTKYPQFRTIQL